VREVDLMQAIHFEVLVILSLILVQGLLAMAGFAVGSARKSRLRDWANQGNRGAAAALRLSEDPRYLHWTMQAWITLVGVLAAVYAGMTVEPVLSRALEPIGQLARYRHVIGLGVVALTITLTTVVLAELVPRSIAHYRPDQVARLVSRPIQVLGWFAIPLVGTLNAGTDFLLRLLGVRPTPEPPVTQEQIQVLIQEGAKAGVFEEGEHEMIKRVFRFCDRRARALMTPRNEIVWIDQTDPPDEIRRKVNSTPHTRFPVCDQSLDNLLGVVDVKNLLGKDQNVDAFRIKGRLTLPLFIYEGTRGLKILEMFKKSPTRVAVVLDEYGTVEGLLTLTDILEAIVGDMPETADEDPPAVQQADGSWLLDGRLPLDEFRDLFDLSTIPEGDFHTLAGLVVTQLGHIPRVAESFDSLGLHFEVVDMDGNRVDRIRVTPLATRNANS
jgi:putative hemolysin